MKISISNPISLPTRPSFSSVGRSVLLVLVFAGLLSPALAQSPQLSSPDTTDEQIQWVISGAVGAAHTSLAALNQQLRAQGNPTFTVIAPSVGLGIVRSLGPRIRLGAEGHIYQWGTGETSTGRAITLRGSYGVMTIGYRLDPLEVLPALQIYPVVGGGAGRFSMKISGGAASFTKLLRSSPSGSSTLYRWSLLGSAAVTVEYRFFRQMSTHFRLGFQIGYLTAPLRTDWYINGLPVSNGPNVHLEGPFIRLTLGRGW